MDDREIDHQIDETQRALKNARDFIERLEGWDEASRLHIEEFKRKLETDLERLRRRREPPDGSSTLADRPAASLRLGALNWPRRW